MEGAGYYTVIVPAPGGFDNTFWTILFNNDTRGKTIQVSGKSSFILWPGQWVWVFQDGIGANWMVTNPGRWMPGSAQNFFVDFVNGSDSNDGLATGAQAFKTIQAAVNVVQAQCDGSFTINLADGTHQVGTGVVVNTAMIGDATINIVGNIGTPNNVILNVNNGGSCITATGPGVQITLNGMQFTITAGTHVTNHLLSTKGAIINFSNVTFGVCINGNHVVADSGGTINVTGAYHIGGGTAVFNTFPWLNAFAGYHIIARFQSKISYRPGVVTIDANSSFYAIFGARFESSILAGQNDALVTVDWFKFHFVNPGFVLNSYQVEAQYNSVISLGLDSGNYVPAGGSSNVDNTTGGYWPI
jgi:hypothetical protein